MVSVQEKETISQMKPHTLHRYRQYNAFNVLFL